jgi:hypothetical protein
VWDLNRINTLASAATKPAPVTELDELMASFTAAEKAKLLAAADRVLNYIDAPTSKVDEAVLDAKITRAIIGGETSLRATLAHLDNNLATIKGGAK